MGHVLSWRNFHLRSLADFAHCLILSARRNQLRPPSPLQLEHLRELHRQTRLSACALSWWRTQSDVACFVLSKEYMGMRMQQNEQNAMPTRTCQHWLLQKWHTHTITQTYAPNTCFTTLQHHQSLQARKLKLIASNIGFKAILVGLKQVCMPKSQTSISFQCLLQYPFVFTSGGQLTLLSVCTVSFWILSQY